MKSLAVVICAALLAGCSTLPDSDRGLALAITIDDLPVHAAPPRGETPATVAKQMIEALRSADVEEPYGFVNGVWTERDPATMRILEIWRSSGFPLGNHTWSHRHLNEMTLEEFEQEVAKNEPLLTQRSRGKDSRWFRYPFLDEGETAEKRNAARQILASRGYRIASVTMDFGDWQWPAAYARCKDAGDEAGILSLERSFLDAAQENIRFYRSLSNGAYGRDIPYVLLLHISSMTARMMPRLIQLYRSEGFRFVSLAEAESDPAYADQMNPDQPAEPQGLEGKAAAKGIALPPRINNSAMLEKICRPTAAIDR
jgi:peptidoglycan/xylan/chitin deacetylase (PgdA/CDA1 family)